MIVNTINPATGNVIKSYPTQSEADTHKIIELSNQAQSLWSQKTFSDRAKHLMNLSDILLSGKDNFATLITTEMGKPLKQAKDEVEKCALACRHFAEHTENYLAPRPVKTEMSKSFVTFRPLGIIFAIMPWNFPFWQVFRFAAPALMAGNSGILKHAPITTGCGLEIEHIFKQAGFPENLFRTVVLENSIAEKIITHSDIAAVTLTGSHDTGKKIGALSAGVLKKIVLELGGSDPYIILEDADLDQAASAIVTSRMINAGQSCIAAKRILAVSAVREELQHKIIEKLKSFKLGDPVNPETTIGPLARADLRMHLHEQITQSVKKGAKILLGGEFPEGPGFYYPPTVLVNIKKNMPAYYEELFGPVISFFDVENEKEAIEVANDTSFGLGAGIFTRNVEHGEQVAVNLLKAGSVFVNDFVRSDPRLPFGGIKGSGFGRELSQEGIQEFVNIKTISIR
jgi:succinate-semialdehyde dehydrogenase/glutarate-semialdehyde dehydrogenase